jgi:hypothetical protein
MERNGLKVPCRDDVTSYGQSVKPDDGEGAQYSPWLKRLSEAEASLSQTQRQAILDFVEWQLSRHG